METRGSTARGLREGDPCTTPAFLRFFDIVQHEAANRGKVFFIDTGDGDVEMFDDMECESLQGWLVDASDADAFEEQWNKGWDAIDDRFFDGFSGVDWARTGDTVTVSFISLPHDPIFYVNGDNV